jgi:hypothetical protein
LGFGGLFYGNFDAYAKSIASDFSGGASSYLHLLRDPTAYAKYLSE